MKNLLLCFLTMVSHYVIAQHQMKILDSFDKTQASQNTIAQAKIAFEFIKKAPIKGKKRKQRLNNCENKAAFSSIVLKKMGFKPSIFWLLKEGLVEEKYNTKNLVEKSPGLRFSSKSWRYHVAAGVIIDNETYILDPWTKKGLVKLSEWALSFFPKYNTDNKRVAYIFPVNDNYKYFGQTKYGSGNGVFKKFSKKKEDWVKNRDASGHQMYCGLAGITPNGKCGKNRFRRRIARKKAQINAYLKKIPTNE